VKFFKLIVKMSSHLFALLKTCRLALVTETANANKQLIALNLGSLTFLVSNYFHTSSQLHGVTYRKCLNAENTMIF